MQKDALKKPAPPPPLVPIDKEHEPYNATGWDMGSQAVAPTLEETSYRISSPTPTNFKANTLSATSKGAEAFTTHMPLSPSIPPTL